MGRHSRRYALAEPARDSFLGLRSCRSRPGGPRSTEPALSEKQHRHRPGVAGHTPPSPYTKPLPTTARLASASTPSERYATSEPARQRGSLGGTWGNAAAAQAFRRNSGWYRRVRGMCADMHHRAWAAPAFILRVRHAQGHLPGAALPFGGAALGRGRGYAGLRGGSAREGPLIVSAAARDHAAAEGPARAAGLTFSGQRPVNVRSRQAGTPECSRSMTERRQQLQ